MIKRWVLKVSLREMWVAVSHEKEGRGRGVYERGGVPSRTKRTGGEEGFTRVVVCRPAREGCEVKRPLREWWCDVPHEKDAS